jgi:parallel beta-helix repeat protein
MKKAVSGVLIALLILISTLMLPLNIQPIRAWSGTIYIRADGSIEPPDAPIILYGGVTYTLTGDIISSTDGVIVERNNIIINGAGHFIRGKGAGNGIDVSYRTNVTIKNVKIVSFSFGIKGDSSGRINVFNNEIEADASGIFLVMSSNNYIDRNRITGAIHGAGVFLCDVRSSMLVRNTITRNALGVDLYCSRGNILCENIISDNGVWVSGSSNNKIYHNNFINSKVQIFTQDVNFWDNGYPSGGNYWSDYKGVDERSGPNQDQPGSDGVGDTPYVIDANNVDHYPLMQPYSLAIPSPPSQVEIKSFTVSGKSFEVGDEVRFDLTIKNPTTYLLTYWVQVIINSANKDSAGNQLIIKTSSTSLSLNAGESTQLSLTWKVPMTFPRTCFASVAVFDSDPDGDPTLKPIAAAPGYAFMIEGTGDFDISYVEVLGSVDHRLIHVHMRSHAWANALNYYEWVTMWTALRAFTFDVIAFKNLLTRLPVEFQRTVNLASSEPYDLTIVQVYDKVGFALETAPPYIIEKTLQDVMLSNLWEMAKSANGWSFSSLPIPSYLENFVTISQDLLDYPVPFYSELTIPIVLDTEKLAPNDQTFTPNDIVPITVRVRNPTTGTLVHGASVSVIVYDPESYAGHTTPAVTPLLEGDYGVYFGFFDLKMFKSAFNAVPLGDYYMVAVAAKSATEAEPGLFGFNPIGYFTVVPSRLKVSLYSPANLLITDPSGRRIGADPATGQSVNEIPGAFYSGPDAEPEQIIIPNPIIGSYSIALKGTTSGCYTLAAEYFMANRTSVRTFNETEISYIEAWNIIMFNATDIPTSPDATHQYTIDWAALSRGEEGVTVMVDSDGDGVFEHTFTSDSELTQSEYVIATDDIPPQTWLNIGEPKIVVNGITYLTSATPIELIAEDNYGGSGVASTAYRIYNASYDSGWINYTQQFYLIGLSDGAYYIDFNSTDYAGNVEPTNTVKVTLFSWQYTYKDALRGTALKININHNFFQFITPDKDFGVRQATSMYQSYVTIYYDGKYVSLPAIVIRHSDSQLRLEAYAGTDVQFCYARAVDYETGKRYMIAVNPS